MFNSKREKIVIYKKDGVIETTVSKNLATVLYANGKTGKSLSLWSTHNVSVKKGKAKDAIPVEVKKRKYNQSTEIKKLKIPFTALIDVKSIGEVKYETVLLPGYEDIRVPNIINAETVIDKEVWDKLTPKQQLHLKNIDTWDAYDELIKYLSSSNRKPSFYAGALQQIYNRAKRPTRRVRKTKKVPTHSLINVDIDITIQSKNFKWLKHLTEGSIEHCNGQIVRTYAFNIPRSAIIKNYLKENKV